MFVSLFPFVFQYGTPQWHNDRTYVALCPFKCASVRIAALAMPIGVAATEVVAAAPAKIIVIVSFSSRSMVIIGNVVKKIYLNGTNAMTVE